MTVVELDGRTPELRLERSQGIMRPSRSGSDPLEVCAEFCPPASPKGIERKRADAGDLGRDRGLLESGHQPAIR